MRRKNLLSVFGVVWLLCFGLAARGQTPITITGPVTICAGNPGAYTISPTAGYHYLWSVTPLGTIIGSPTAVPTVNVLWGAAGTATVTVDGYDSSNTLQQVGNLTVTVEPIPAPYITADKIAGCQNYADTPTQKGDRGFVPGDPHILDDANGCPKVCDSSVVIYTANGAVGSSYTWTVAGGTIIGLAGNTCTVYWNGPVGFGSVSVTETSAFGCVGTKSVCIDIIAKPHADFATLSPICFQQTSTFTDLSTADPTSPIISWFWDFGDGGTYSTSSSTSVTHTYTSPGTYNVMLVVRNECGCTDTFNSKVTVEPQKGVTISCHGVVCDSGTATYSLQPAVSCSPYQWQVVGGTIVAGAGSPTITVWWTDIDSTGFGTIIFNPSTCGGIACPSPTYIRVPVVTPNGYVFGPKVVCPNSQYLYNLPQWPTTTFNWTVLTSTGATVWPTDQSNQIALNTMNPGVIVLKCVYKNTMLGCGGIAYDTIEVVKPDSIIGQTEQCFNATGSYHLADGATALWTLTYPNNSVYSVTTSSFSAPFNQVGTYSLNASGSFCLSQPLVIKVNARPPAPDSLLGPDTVCFGQPAEYIAKNPVPGTIFDWAAVTGTVHFSSGDHTTATFSGSSPATIMVWRETTDAEHCYSDTLSMLVYKPVVSLNITGTDTVCPSTQYTYNSGYSQGETYHWQVIDPHMGSVQNDGGPTAQILFNTLTGPVNIIVTVTRCDTTVSDTLHAYVRPLPPLFPNISPKPVCRDAPMTATLSGVTGTITWDFGDGSTGTGATAVHAYTALSGTSTNYTVAVTVTNPFGCPGTVTADVVETVLPAPVANVTPAGPFSSCTAPNQPLTATLTAGYEPTAELIWEKVGSGPVSTCTGPPFSCNPYTVSSYGTYYVIAIGDTDNCADTSNLVVFDTCHIIPPCTITGHPTVSIIKVTGSCGTVHIDGAYSSPPPTAFSWNWTWPAGALGVSTTNTSIDCHFATAGYYDFTYTVGFFDTNHDTCYFTVDTSVLVPLIAGMEHGVTCAGSSYHVTMYDHSNYEPGYQPTGYSWYVNNVYQTTTGTSPYTVTLAPGASYTLSEWVHYNGGADSCQAFDNVFLDSLPHASFTFARDTTCTNDAAVAFTNTSTPSTPWSSLWDFGDVTGNTQASPWKVYSNVTSPTNFIVTLTISNEYGCTSSASKLVPIVPEKLGGGITGDSIACAGSVVTLTFNTSLPPNVPTNYYWMNDLDSMYMTTVGNTNVYSSGSYWLTGTDQYGCVVNTNHINATFLSVPHAVISGDTSACLNVPYTLNGYAGSDPTITYTWLKNGSNVGSSASYTDPAAATGTFTYTLIISVPNPEGGSCSDTSAPFKVTVHGLPAAPTISYNIVDCNTYTMKLSASGPASGTYNWSNSMLGQNINVPDAGGPYKVWYTDTYGCMSSSSSVMVPRDPRLFMWIFPSGCYGPWCTSSLPREIVGPIYPFYYWAYLLDPSTIVETGPTNTPVSPYNITGPGDYQLILNNTYCTDTSDAMDVTVDNTCQPCKLVQFKETGIYQTGCDPIPTGSTGFSVDAAPADTCCHTFVIIQFTNTYGMPIGVNVTATNGGLAPGGALVLPGTNIDTFQFLNDPGFYGGVITITITYTDPTTGLVNTCQQSVTIPPCRQGSTGRLSNAGDGDNKGQTVVSTDGTSRIRLVPNPAQDETRVDYQYTGNAKGSYIEVYDMVGRLVAKHPLTDNAGSWQLQLDNFSAGIYQVVLRQGGGAILQSRLSVTH